MRRFRLLFVVIVGPLMAASTVHAAPPDVDEHDGRVRDVKVVESSVNGESNDVDWYAQRYAVPADEASRRLATEARLGAIGDQFPDARIRIRHDQAAGLTIELFRSQGEKVDQALGALRAVAGVAAVEVVDSGVARPQFDRRLATAHRWAQATRPDAPVDINGDELTGEVWVVSDRDDVVADLTALSGRPAEVAIRRGTPARPSWVIWAGESAASCTLGFNLRSTNGTRYASSAGHCPETNTYYLGGALGWHIGAYFGSHDVRSYTLGPNTATNKLYTGGGVRSITSAASRSSLFIGGTACKYGKTTGYGCGTIISKSVAPGYVPSVSATFIEVAGCPNTMGEDGDSGGPWFLNNKAYGWMSGAGGPNGCGQNNAYFMAANYVSVLGLSVLTTP